MKRRDFIHINIAALGGVLINNHFSYAQAMEEISQSFQYVTEQSGYDLIINGAGLSGCCNRSIQARNESIGYR